MTRLDPTGRAVVDQRQLSQVAADRHELIQAARAARTERRRRRERPFGLLAPTSVERTPVETTPVQTTPVQTTAPAPAHPVPQPEPAC